MRTTLDLDSKLLEDVVRATGQKSKVKAVSKALEEYIRKDRLKRLLGLQGKLDLALDDPSLNRRDLLRIEAERWLEARGIAPRTTPG